jgi:hypothetical protein
LGEKRPWTSRRRKARANGKESEHRKSRTIKPNARVAINEDEILCIEIDTVFRDKPIINRGISPYGQ